MNILIVGAGGREHALAKKISASPLVKKVLVAPGNPGMSWTEKVELIQSAPEKIVENYKIDLVVIGPEGPLAEGLADRLRDSNIKVVGPSQQAAQLESSKGFAKTFMKRHEIPTASFAIFSDSDEACAYLDGWHLSQKVVVKADGLAAGKGVFICDDPCQAQKRIKEIFGGEFIITDRKIVIEEFLEGRELSVFVLAAGRDYKILGQACDYKRLLNDDQGPNTGGMGCITSGSWPGEGIEAKIKVKIIEKTLDGMVSDETPFNGFLYFGLMINGEKINVIEYNVRLGDPETQVILPLIKSDLVPSLMACASGKLDSCEPIEIDCKEAVHVVVTSGNYANPFGDAMLLDQEIHFGETSLDQIYFSGVRLNNNNRMVNSGGRVLGITALAKDLEEARMKVYNLIENIRFEGMYWRDDIGKK